MGSSGSESEYDVTTNEDIVDVPVESMTAEDIRTRQKWLKPTDYMSPGNEYMKHLQSHISGTGDWLRDSPSFQRWRGPENKGCLWVHGVPGSGKSVFAATVAKQPNSEGSPVLFFFFRQIVATNHEPKYLVRDWLSQLLPHSRMLQSKLKYMGRKIDGIELTELWDELCECLTSMPNNVYCIADALDEMDDNQDDLIVRLKELGRRKPVTVKVMLTSRPITRITNILRSPEVMSIKLDPTLIHPDIVKYVNARLGTLEPRLHAAKERELKGAICARAEGLFLHARLLTDNLTEGLREGTTVEETLPVSLE